MANEKRTSRDWDRILAEEREKHWMMQRKPIILKWERLLDQLHMYHPKYIKHPTEDRQITFGEWKHEMRVITRQSEYEWRRVMQQYSMLRHVDLLGPLLFHRPQYGPYITYAERKKLWEAEGKKYYGQPVIIVSILVVYESVKAAVPHIKHLARYPQTHIMPWNRRTMQRQNLTEEDMLARKAENLAIRSEGRKFWKLVTENESLQSATLRFKYVARYHQTHIMPWERGMIKRRGLTEEEVLARKAKYYEASRLFPRRKQNTE